MEIFLMLAAVISAVATIATNAVNINNANEQLENQQSYAHREAELANQRQLENYWETQSPQSRVQQLKDAGLSVGLMYGGSAAGGGINTGTQAQTPSASLPIMQNPINSSMGDLFENLKKVKESELLGTEKEKTMEETNKIKSDIEVNNATIVEIATQNNLTNVLTANAKLDGVFKEIENEVAQATKGNRIEIVSKQLENMKTEGEKMLKEIEGLNIDNNNKQRMYDATIKKITAETSLTWKQVVKTEAETVMTKATTVLTTEQTNLTFAERQKIYKDIEQLKTINAKIEAEIKLMEQQTEKVKLEKVSEIIGWIESAAQIADKISGTVLKASFMPK